MKNFKEYITENKPWMTKEHDGFKYSIIDTNHAILRAIERESNHKEIADKFTTGIFDYLNKNLELHSKNQPKFLFYSKILGRGIVMKVKHGKDPYYKILLVVTVLPKKKYNETWPSKDETKVLVEGYDNFISDEFNMYLNSINLDEYKIDYYKVKDRFYDLTNMIPAEVE